MSEIKVQPLSQLPALELDRSGVDVRGWALLDSEGNTAGRIDDLIVDADALTVVALQIRAGTETMRVAVNTVEVDGASKLVRLRTGVSGAVSPDLAPPGNAAGANGAVMRVTYRSTVGLVWWAAALGVAALLIAWMVRALIV